LLQKGKLQTIGETFTVYPFCLRNSLGCPAASRCWVKKILSKKPGVSGKVFLEWYAAGWFF